MSKSAIGFVVSFLGTIIGILIDQYTPMKLIGEIIAIVGGVGIIMFSVIWLSENFGFD